MEVILGNSVTVMRHESVDSWEPVRVRDCWGTVAPRSNNCVIRWFCERLSDFAIMLLVLVNYSWSRPVRSQKMVELQSDKLLHAIRLNQYDVQKFCDGRLKYLVCGEDVYSQLTDENLSSPFMWSIPTAFSDRLQVFGLKVVFVPWMTGWVAIPDPTE